MPNSSELGISHEEIAENPPAPTPPPFTSAGTQRRTFLKFGAAAIATAALGATQKDRILNLTTGGKEMTFDTILGGETPESSPLGVADFRGVPEKPVLKEMEGITGSDIQKLLNRAIAESLASGSEQVIELPEGELVVNDTIQCDIPEGAKIVLKGHENGTRLKLSKEKSAVPKEWGSFGQNCLLLLKNIQGEVTIDGMSFDGGSERAGKYGYAPPASPWDSVVFAIGHGEGDKYDPAMDRQGKRNGKVTIRNSSVYDSESGGFLLQNLHTVDVKNIHGKNLDTILNTTWCDTIQAAHITGKNFTSDGLYITSAENIVLQDIQIATSRQGYDLQGVRKAILTNCNAYDCLNGYVLTSSETDKKTTSGEITILNSDTKGCWQPYSIGPMDKLTIQNARNDEVGAWMQGFNQRNFLHNHDDNTNTGIVDPSAEIRSGLPISIFSLSDKLGRPLHARRDFRFSNVSVRLSKDRETQMRLITLPGVTYSQEPGGPSPSK